MNVVLIHPYIKVREVNLYNSEPLGLLCLASWLDAVFKDTINVSILDLYALGAMVPEKQGDFFCLGIDDPDFIAGELKKLEPDLIGITCSFTAYAQDTLELTDIIKTIIPATPIVIGGAHPTIEASSILQNCKSVDFVARGEGEIILENLVRALQGEMEMEDVDGLSFRKNGEIIVNKPVSLIEDLDVLPIPSRHYIDRKKYNYFNKESIWYARKNPVVTIMTSRGCPYDCVFCSTKVVWERRWRFRSLEDVFREIRMLVEDCNIKEIVIADDQFMVNKERVHAFCDYFTENKMDVCFSLIQGISPWLMDEELLGKMKKAGFYALAFPIESGCKETLEYIKKPIDLDHTKMLIEKANKLGFWTSTNVIVGFPPETKEQIMETINYVYHSTLDFVSFFIAKPVAGSEMYENFRKEGVLDEVVVRGSDVFRSDYDTPHLTAKELDDIRNQAASRWFIHKFLFYINPKNFYNYFLPKVRGYDDLVYFVSICFTLIHRKIRQIYAEHYKVS